MRCFYLGQGADAGVRAADGPNAIAVSPDGTTGAGCTTKDGVSFFGTMTFVRSGGALHLQPWPGSSPPPELPFGTLSFDGFGETTDGPCPDASWVAGISAPKTTGTASITADGSQRAHFTVDLRTVTPKTPASCPPAPLTIATEYQGTIAASGKAQVTLDGSGTFGTSVDGTVAASTKGETGSVSGSDIVMWAGTPTLRAEGQVSVLSYGHGADTFAPADWTLDGNDQGGLRSVSCATMPGRGRMPGLLSVLTVLGLAALRRRRRPGGIG